MTRSVVTPEGVLTITLDDGRTLAYREYGDPKGVPCIYTSGTPASAVAGEMGHPVAARHGVRWISLDKPGYGYSTYQPGRTLLDWPKDVAQMADHLGLQRFAVAGESGGGPHALALAYALPERITTAVVLAGMGPADDPNVVEGMNRLNKLLMRSAIHAPWLLRLAMGSMARSFAEPAKAQKFMRKRAAAAPPTDREAFMQPAMLAALSEGFRQGARAASDEMRIFAKPWGFRIEDITAHVDLFHGVQDMNVPIAIARSVAARLQNCTARMLPEYGHAVGLYIGDEAMQCVRNAT